MLRYTFAIEHVRPGDRVQRELWVDATSPEHAGDKVRLHIYEMGARPEWYRWRLTHVDGRPYE